MTDHLPIYTPTMPKEVFLELIEALDELDSAFGGRPTAESVNAREWLQQATKVREAQTPAPVASGEAR